MRLRLGLGVSVQAEFEGADRDVWKSLEKRLKVWASESDQC